MRKLGLSAVLACAWLASCGGSGGDGTLGGFSDADLALVSIMPQDLESSVARNRMIQFVFNVDVDPDSVNDQSIRIRTLSSAFSTDSTSASRRSRPAGSISAEPGPNLRPSITQQPRSSTGTPSGVSGH